VRFGSHDFQPHVVQYTPESSELNAARKFNLIKLRMPHRKSLSKSIKAAIRIRYNKLHQSCTAYTLPYFFGRKEQGNPTTTNGEGKSWLKSTSFLRVLSQKVLRRINVFLMRYEISPLDVPGLINWYSQLC